MFDAILNADTQLFLLVNQKLANGIFDFVMPFITNSDHWIIPLVLVWLALIIFGGTKGRVTAVLILIIVILSDQVSSSVIKPWIKRPRPCNPDHVIEGARYLMGLKKSFSFPSSHAANNAAAATLFAIRYPKWKWFPITIAVMVSYSRIYVGVHFPLDVIFGALLGWILTLIVLKIKDIIIHYIQIKKEAKASLGASSPHPDAGGNDAG